MGAKPCWPYADWQWWVEALTYSVHSWPLRGDGMTVPKSWVSADTHRALKSAYEAALDALRREDLEPAVAATLLFRAKALTKWEFAEPGFEDERKKAALAGFFERNNLAASYGQIPYPYSVVMREYLKKWLPDPDKTGYGWTGRFGPGAVAEHLTHPQRFAKLCEWCEFGPHWPEVPLAVQDAKHTSARLHAVPKDALKDRLITVEPCYATFAQAWFREALQVSIHAGPLRGTCMDLAFVDGPEVQRRLARRASRTGELATIDLSDASDGITYEMVCQVFPSWVCALADVSRSETFICDRPDLSQHKVHKLWIYAGMGNGSTFTIETLFFAAFVRAYAHCHGLRPYVSVFGDDIICDSEVARRLAGERFPFFKVNACKSFWGCDRLRESCGIYAYKGVDITAPYIRGFPESLRGTYGICDLWWRLNASTFAYAKRLASTISATGLLSNWPFVADSYPSISDEFTEWSASPEIRTNRYTQSKEAKLPKLEQLVARYPTDWRVARRYNQPDPRTWLCARLCGMLASGDVRIEHRTARASLSVSVPIKGQMRTRRCWQAIEPADVYRARRLNLSLPIGSAPAKAET